MAHPGLKAVSLAAKGVGSQGDGTVQVLCRGPEEQKQVGYIINHKTPKPVHISINPVDWIFYLMRCVRTPVFKPSIPMNRCCNFV